MRFLVDQCVDVFVNAWLRERGHDSVHLREQQLQRLPNGKIFEKAAAEQRVIVTIDLDFGEILSMCGTTVVSTIVFRVYNTRGEFLVRRLDAVLPMVSAALERGAIVIIEDARFRIRELPF